MPLYLYEDVVTGERVELFRPIEERDAVLGFRRIFEGPTAIPPGTVEDPWSMEAQMRAGLKKAEERDRGKLERESLYSTRELAAAWK